jgi:hypothetical protein
MPHYKTHPEFKYDVGDRVYVYYFYSKYHYPSANRIVSVKTGFEDIKGYGTIQKRERVSTRGVFSKRSPSFYTVKLDDGRVINHIREIFLSENPNSVSRSARSPRTRRLSHNYTRNVNHNSASARLTRSTRSASRR